MLKKVIGFTILFILFIFLGQILLGLLKTNHELEYSIKINDEIYTINEKYNLKKEKDLYELTIKYENNEYLFDVENDFNKHKQIVNNIYEYKNNEENVTCLALEYTNKNVSIPICRTEEGLVSYFEIKNKYDFSEYEKKINYEKRLNVQNNEFEKDKIIPTDMKIYRNNLYDNETLIIYDYKRLFSVKKDDLTKLTFSTIDVHDNNYGHIIDKYYFEPRTKAKTPEYIEYYLFDLDTGITMDIEFPKKLSKNIYINGIYDNKLYIFDKSNLIQIEVDPEEKDSRVYCTEKSECLSYVNGEKKNVSVYDLKNENIIFSENMDKYKDLNYKTINYNDFYATYYDGNAFYKVYNDNLEKPIILLKKKNVLNVKITENGIIYYLQDNKIYRYDDKGLIYLAEREDFKYNNKNIYEIMVK